MGNPKILVIKNFLKQNFTLKNNLTRLIFVVIGIAIVLSYCLPIYFNLKNLSEGEHGSGFIFINIQHNSGISFSMFNDSPNTAKFLQCFVVICIFISLLFFKKWYYLLLIGMAFTGGMFNFVDRCANGSVLDYFSFSFASGNSWNMPDASILTGIIGACLVMVIIYIVDLFKKPSSKNSKKQSQKKE